MSSPPHLGGDVVGQTTEEEHVHEALAKRVLLTLLNAAATEFGSPTLLQGTLGDAMMVGIADPTTGGPIAVQNPGDLADGTLTSTQTTLYTATAKTWVTKIRVRNTGASTRTVTVGFRSSSSATVRHPWSTAVLLTHESADFLADEGILGMSVGNILVGSQDAGTDVDYLISGEALS